MICLVYCGDDSDKLFFVQNVSSSVGSILMMGYDMCLSDPKNQVLHSVFIYFLGQEPASAKGQSMFFAPQQKLQEQVKMMEAMVPKDPPPEYEFITDPACISAFDL